MFHIYIKKELKAAKLTNTDLIYNLSLFDPAFINLDSTTLNRWASKKTTPSHYKQILIYLFFNSHILDFIKNATNITTTKTDNILHCIFKYKKIINYNTPKIHNYNLEIVETLVNKNEKKNKLKFFYLNINFYREINKFIENNSLDIESYFIEEVDTINNIITSHIQFSLVTKENYHFFTEFLNRYNLFIEIKDDIIIFDICFFKDKETFDNLLLVSLKRMINLNIENNDIYCFTYGNSFIPLLETWGGNIIGIIKNEGENIYLVKINFLHLLSNKYIINLLQHNI